ncbi:TetR family transcriptional regulator [Haloactinopolyspora alba]|uniref:TetR family transcriptional regulator n=1 Tax=Haloactinopolyspora alba TaxID=648780 RepID=A0A2P8DY17_9ACTN|nr:TetR/AcrR family transcriptional regulator [Haloactinopolyspora alba]PSL02083.1 TetR family transcriptional regulator [Haloactinopolyspora alba]
MTTDGHAAGTDRLMAVLWGRERPPRATTGPRLGRRPALTIDDVVVAGVDLADAEGLDSLSMSRLARRLRVGTMTLYTYVGSKAELVALMVDEVLAERALPGADEPRPAGWRTRLELYAERTRGMFGAHRWLHSGASVQPPLGPGLTDGKEYLLSALDGTGLTARRRNAVAGAVAFFVDAAAASESSSPDATASPSDDGGDGDGWWQDAFDPARYPATVDVWRHGGFDVPADNLAEFSFAFGFARLLDGIEATMMTRRPGTAEPAPVAG